MDMSAALLPGDSLSDVMQQLHAQRSATSALEPLQSTACVLMIAPIHAAFNEDCAGDNHCHATAHGASESADDAAACMREFSSCVTALRSHGVKVWVYVPDDNAVTPDAHFPNNWISTYAGAAASPAAAIDVHSMRWPSRRLERRADVTRSLLQACPPLPHALYHSCNDLSKGEEEEGGVLEGTGSLVLDRVGKRAFVARSQRSGAAAAEAWAALHGCLLLIFILFAACSFTVLCQIFARVVRRVRWHRAPDLSHQCYDEHRLWLGCCLPGCDRAERPRSGVAGAERGRQTSG